MMNVIISESLYDKEFVEQWTVGFDKLEKHVQKYTPEWAEKITGVAAEDIKKIARMYATTKPASLDGGMKLQQCASGFHNSRSLVILEALTGNIDVPGGGVRFSFNVRGGRCETCLGAGVKMIEMNFLPDVSVECDACHGARYNRETLQVKYKGKSISDVLNMTINEATSFFENIPSVYQKLNTLREVGLGYIRLGQPSTTILAPNLSLYLHIISLNLLPYSTNLSTKSGVSSES